MKRIADYGPACLAVAFLMCSGCDKPQSGSERPASRDTITAGDRLLGLQLDKENFRSYLSVREAAELRSLADSPAKLREVALDYHSDVVLARYAESEGLGDDPLLQQRLAKARRDLLLQALVDEVEADLVYPEPDVLEQRALERYQRAADDEFVTPSGRRVAHILLSRENCRLRGSDVDLNEILAEVRSRLDAGEDFAVLAREYSEDPGSWRSGGELPEPIRRDGRAAPAFEDAVFSLSEVGQISEPVRTPFGIHLIKLLEVIEPQPIPFERARESLIAQEKQRIRFSALEKLRSSAYPDPEAIDVEALVAIVESAAESRAGTP